MQGIQALDNSLLAISRTSVVQERLLGEQMAARQLLTSVGSGSLGSRQAEGFAQVTIRLATACLV
uniref:Uncharacterized protein n=1 Tax=uncultured Planctomycetota bacterium TaxID=120965 RepID=H5SII3_9BACT|nr:hypothetical protein HGMM_F33C03C12 [uncultured Planctomycetota bacterium]